MTDTKTKVHGEHLGKEVGWVFVRPPEGWKMYELRIHDDGVLTLNWEKIKKDAGGEQK